MDGIEGATPAAATPEPAVVAAADPGAGAGLTPQVDDASLTDLEILNQTDEPEAKPEVKRAADVPPADDGKPAEAKPDAAADQKPPAEKTAEQKAAEAESQAMLEPGDKAVEELREAIKTDTELAAALEKNPQLRNRMYRNARLAVDAAAFKEQFATIELAKMAKTDAEDFGTLESHYFTNKPEGFKEIRKFLWEGDLKRDAKGEPLRDGSGQFVVEGKYDAFFHDYRVSDFYPALLGLAKQHGKEAEVSEAVAVIREFLGETDEGAAAATRKPAASATADDSRLTPEEKADLAEHQRLKREQAQANQRENETYTNTVKEAVQDGVTGFLLGRVQKLAPAMSEPIQKKVASDAFNEINRLAAQDPLFQRLKKQIMRAGGDEAKNRLKTEAVKYAEARYRDVLSKLVKEYGAPVVQQNGDTRKTLDAQKNRTEVKGGGGAPSPTPQDETAMLAEGDKLSQQVNSRRLNSLEIMSLDEILPELRRKAALKVAASR